MNLRNTTSNIEIEDIIDKMKLHKIRRDKLIMEILKQCLSMVKCSKKETEFQKIILKKVTMIPMIITNAKMLLSEKPNKEMIITALKEAGDKGDLKAMYYAGVLFATNDGEPYDLGEAAKYYKKAADLGYPDSMFSFG